MLKKIALGVLVGLVVLTSGLFFWARTVLTGENVRATLAAQVEKAIGQPVTIGALSATVMPRVTLTLGQVTIGGPKKIAVGELHVGTDFRALLSRRIEHARLELTGARIELPLPEFTLAESTTPPASTAEEPGTKPPVELVSIDAIVLRGVEIVSGGHTLRGDIELVPQGAGVIIRKFELSADGTTVSATGAITNLKGPVGELSVKAGALNLDQLLAFVDEFTAGSGLSDEGVEGPAPTAPAAAAAPAVPSGVKLVLSLEAESAALGALTLTKLAGKARVSDEGLILDPVSFGIFGGQYQGALTLVPGATLRFRGSSTLSNVDVAAATAFAGSPNTVSGRLSGRLDFAGSGADPTAVMKTVTGKARVELSNGVVSNLGLVNAVVVATSLRPASLAQSAAAVKSGSRDEPFSKLGATIRIAKGVLSTDDLLFESRDVILSAQGDVQLIASRMDLKGRVQLSETLSKQANTELTRYTQDQGKVTFPATVSGAIEAPSVKIDAGDMAKRAIKNAVNEQKERAKEEATKAATKKLSGFLKH